MRSMKPSMLVVVFAAALAACAADGDGRVMKPIYTVPHELDMLTGNGHPQGMACSEEAMYVSCSAGIVKLDWSGHVVNTCKTVAHLGDIAYAAGRIYGTYALWDQPKGQTPLMVGVWDENLNFVTNSFYSYPNARGFDSAVVLGDTLYTCVDHRWDGKTRFYHPPHCDSTVMMIATGDLSVKGVKDVVFDYPIYFATQCLATDGTTLFFCNYGACRNEGNEKGYNFSRVTAGLKLVDSRRFDAFYGFALVPKAVSGPGRQVFARVNALGCGQHGWWRDPKWNPARIKFDFFSYDKDTGELKDVTDRSVGSGYPETIFIEEEKPLELTADAWKPGAGDWASVTWRIPWEFYKDFRVYDRIAVDYVNESGEEAGTELQCFVAGERGHVNEGLHAKGGYIPAFGYRRWEYPLSRTGWAKAKNVNPANIARVHFFLYRPKSVKLKIYRITLLPKGVECPPPAEGFRKKVLEPLEKRIGVG